MHEVMLALFLALSGAWLGAVLGIANNRTGLARDLLLTVFGLGLGTALGAAAAALI